MFKSLNFLILFSLVSCSNSNHQIIDLLKNKYANLSVNDQSNKEKVITDLAQLLETKPLNEFNYQEISYQLNKLNDGHVYLRNDVFSFDDFRSDIKFIRGDYNFLESCLVNCSPIIPAGKYQILTVDGTDYRDWLDLKGRGVYASTSWGRLYRASRKLIDKENGNAINITILDSNKSIIKTEVSYTKVQPKLGNCVESERVDNETVKININTLWCDRDQKNVFKGFKSDWDKAISQITNNDKIILDLRENNGGGDDEVRYIYNTFSVKPFTLYKYQYLFLTSPGWKKHIFGSLGNYFPGEKGIDLTVSDVNPPKKFLTNKIITLISSGCFSSCEGIASLLKESGRSILVGDKTHGGAGGPIFYKITGTNYSLNLPTCITYKSTGELIEGVGVTPNQFILQDPTIASDNVLDWALKN